MKLQTQLRGELQNQVCQRFGPWLFGQLNCQLSILLGNGLWSWLHVLMRNQMREQLKK